MLIVHVHVQVKPESVEEFRQATLENARASVQEPGIARFDVVHSRTTPRASCWSRSIATPEAPAAHKETAHYAKWRDAVAPMMAEPRTSLSTTPSSRSRRAGKPCASNLPPRPASSSARARPPSCPSWRAASARMPLVVTGARPSARHALARGDSAAATFAVAGEPTVDLVRDGARRARERRLRSGGRLRRRQRHRRRQSRLPPLLTNGGEPLDYLEVIGQGARSRSRAAALHRHSDHRRHRREVTRNAVLGSPEHGVKASLRSPLMLPRARARRSRADPRPAARAHRQHRARRADAADRAVRLRARQSPDRRALHRGHPPRRRRAAAARFTTATIRDARRTWRWPACFGGLALANAGLGAVHGFAAPLGGMFDRAARRRLRGAAAARHGGQLPRCARARRNIRRLRALRRGRAPAHRRSKPPPTTASLGARLVAELQSRAPRLRHRRSRSPGVVEKAARASSMKANPLPLTGEELQALLAAAW